MADNKLTDAAIPALLGVDTAANDRYLVIDVSDATRDPAGSPHYQEHDELVASLGFGAFDPTGFAGGPTFYDPASAAWDDGGFLTARYFMGGQNNLLWGAGVGAAIMAASPDDGGGRAYGALGATSGDTDGNRYYEAYAKAYAKPDGSDAQLQFFLDGDGSGNFSGYRMPFLVDLLWGSHLTQTLTAEPGQTAPLLSVQNEHGSPIAMVRTVGDLATVDGYHEVLISESLDYSTPYLDLFWYPVADSLGMYMTRNVSTVVEANLDASDHGFFSVFGTDNPGYVEMSGGTLAPITGYYFKARAHASQTQAIIDLRDSGDASVFAVNPDGSGLFPGLGKLDMTGFDGTGAGAAPTFFAPSSAHWYDAGWAQLANYDSGVQLFYGWGDAVAQDTRPFGNFFAGDNFAGYGAFTNHGGLGRVQFQLSTTDAEIDVHGVAGQTSAMFDAVSSDGTHVLQVTGDKKVGLYGHAPVALQTGVAVTAAAIHAALVNLGAFTA